MRIVLTIHPVTPNYLALNPKLGLMLPSAKHGAPKTHLALVISTVLPQTSVGTCIHRMPQLAPLRWSACPSTLKAMKLYLAGTLLIQIIKW